MDHFSFMIPHAVNRGGGQSSETYRGRVPNLLILKRHTGGNEAGLNSTCTILDRRPLNNGLGQHATVSRLRLVPRHNLSALIVSPDKTTIAHRGRAQPSLVFRIEDPLRYLSTIEERWIDLLHFVDCTLNGIAFTK